jgi:hypothetical protein
MPSVCPHLAFINRGETRTVCTRPTVFKYLLPSNRQTAADYEDSKLTIIHPCWRRLGKIAIRVNYRTFVELVARLQETPNFPTFHLYRLS